MDDLAEEILGPLGLRVVKDLLRRKGGGVRAVGHRTECGNAAALGGQKAVGDGQKALRCRFHRDKIGMNEKHGVTSQKFT